MTSAQQAPAVLIYSPSGIGKTVCALRALTPEKTLWISTERGALKPASNPELNPWHPRRPREVVCLRAPQGPDDTAIFTEFESAIRAATAAVLKGVITNVVIDTISSFTRRLDDYEQRICGLGREYGRAAAAVARHVMPNMDMLFETIVRADRPTGARGALLVCLAHERDPFQAAENKRTGEAAKQIAGGPDLPGALMKKIRHDFDLVLRAGVRIAPSGERVRAFIHDSLDEQMPTKDRWGIISDRARGQSGITPMDLRTILRVGMTMDVDGAPRAEDLAVLRQYETASVSAAGGAKGAGGGVAVEDLVDIG